MKLRRLGFKKLPPKPPKPESPLLKDENLPETQQQPGWLKGWHEGEQHLQDAYVQGRIASGVTQV